MCDEYEKWATESAVRKDPSLKNQIRSRSGTVWSKNIADGNQKSINYAQNGCEQCWHTHVAWQDTRRNESTMSRREASRDFKYGDRESRWATVSFLTFSYLWRTSRSLNKVMDPWFHSLVIVIFYLAEYRKPVRCPLLPLRLQYVCLHAAPNKETETAMWGNKMEKG